MTRRLTGLVLISIAAFLFGIRYIAAAIYGAGIFVNNELSQKSFERALDYVGHVPTILSVIALVLGIIYLIRAEWKE